MDELEKDSIRSKLTGYNGDASSSSATHPNRVLTRKGASGGYYCSSIVAGKTSADSVKEKNMEQEKMDCR